MIYVDASAALRVLFEEPGPTALIHTVGVAYASEVFEVEVSCALDRGRLGGRFDDAETARKTRELYDLLDGLRLVPVSREVIDLARGTFPVPVRALDAIHVATAQWLQKERGPLEFWTHDRRQATAALCRALEVRGIEV